MFTSMQVKNFKAWKDTKIINLAPLTVIFGGNSAGKSSLGHFLLALKQTATSTDRKRVFHLGDEKSQVDLGTFKECIHKHNLGSKLQFTLSWKPGGEIVVKNPTIARHRGISGDEMEIQSTLLADAAGQPQVENLTYNLLSGRKNVLGVKLGKIPGKDEYDLVSLDEGKWSFIRNKGRVWAAEAPEKFYRVTERSIAKYQNAGFLADFALETEQALSRLFYLGPLRDHPKRIYAWSGETPDGVGMKGEHSITAILASHNRKLKVGSRNEPFHVVMANMLTKLGIITEFKVRQVAEGRREYEVLVKTHSKAAEVKLTDVGIGVSQVLPAMVSAFYCPPGSTVWMEQPEIHLHPQVQMELADVFVDAIRCHENGRPRGTQLIIESHSEHFLNRLQTRIAEGTLSREEVAIYFCKREGDGSVLEDLQINEAGDILNWPENFFGDEMGEHAARARAASSRKG
jgi:predicted ATPase